MKIYNNVRGTMKYVPTVEVNKDTVYIRSDIERIEEMEFSGWEYNEIQYPLQEYIETLANEEDTGMLALIVSMLMSEVDMLKSEIESIKEGK